MTLLLEWPLARLRPQSAAWNLAGGLVMGGQNGVGVAQSVRLDGGGVWVADYGRIYLENGSRARLFRALRMLLDGGVNPVVLPDCDGIQPWPVESGSPVTSIDQITHSDGTLFSDGTGYGQRVIDIVTVGAAAHRATTMTVDIIRGSALGGGEAFSILHPEHGWRRYEIKTAIEDGGNTVITFGPPLREAVADGVELEFDHPRCVMKLSSVRGADYVHDKHPLSRPSVTFIEAFPPFD